VTNLEYRLNYLIDAVLQPVLASGIEIVFWSAIFLSRTAHNLPTGTSTEPLKIGGFALNSYLAYAIWASFMARISVNWMYEFRMTEEIESGGLNTLLVRPFHFFEYYLSQFIGYKLVTTVISLLVPIIVVYFFDLPMIWNRLGVALLLAVYYLFFLYLISFIISCLAFHITKVHGITVAKNLMLWILSGELLPLDLFPEPYRGVLLKLPFANGVYVPVAYLTGRIEGPQVLVGIESISVGLVVLSALAAWMWRNGLRSYVGTGA
jgi:ABC-2 type transport system permease protein